jgi:hypothetical protein
LTDGTYHCVVLDARVDKWSDGKGFVKFTLQPYSRYDGTANDIPDAVVTLTLSESKVVAQLLNRFLDDCGVRDGTLRDRIAQSVGAHVIAKYRRNHRIATRPITWREP